MTEKNALFKGTDGNKELVGNFPTYAAIAEHQKCHSQSAWYLANGPTKRGHKLWDYSIENLNRTSKEFKHNQTDNVVSIDGETKLQIVMDGASSDSIVNMFTKGRLGTGVEIVY